MNKNNLLMGITLLTILALTGCTKTPEPTAGNLKPTVYVKSNTAEKFKNITKETAIWNGISPYFVKDNQYMRCDMTDEAIVMFANHGFNIVHSQKDADYTLDVTLTSCGYLDYGRDNKSELPLQERSLYKDFMEWLSETEPSKLPKNAKEIAKLISSNNPKGFKLFHDEGYIKKYGNKFGGFLSNWQIADKLMLEYIREYKGIVMPGKYYDISEEDQDILSSYYRGITKDEIKSANSTGGIELVGNGANMMANASTYGNSGAAVGGAAIGIGIIMSLTGVSHPNWENEFKITNNETGKVFKKILYTGQTNWKDKVGHHTIMENAIYKAIDWSDLD